jgi:hypothetical protein
MKRPLFAVLLIVLLSTNAFAGGTYYKAMVDVYSEPFLDGNEYYLVLIPEDAQEGHKGEQCTSMHIKGFYDSKRWARYERPMSVESHKKAMKYLGDHIGKSIEFGAIGNGLIPRFKCNYISRGLFLEETNTRVIVFSVNDRI